MVSLEILQSNHPPQSRVNYSRLLWALSCFKHLQGWKLHSFSGQSGLVFNQVHDKNKLIIMFKWNLLYFNLFLLPFVLSVDTSERSMLPLSLFPPTRGSAGAVVPHNTALKLLHTTVPLVELQGVFIPSCCSA